jgi:hypothetical protein
MYSSARVLEGFGFLCACALIAWLHFIEPICTYLALDEIGWLPTAALACSLSAGLLGAACAIFVIWDIKHSAAADIPHVQLVVADCGLSIAHHADSPLVPIEIRPHVGATLAAGIADELGLNIGKPNMISPSIAADSE